MAEEDPNLLSEGKKQEDDADNEIAVTDGTLPKEIDEVLDSIPDQKQANVVRRIMSLQFSAISATPENAISKKITSDHISQYLNDSRVAMQESFKEHHEDKIFKWVIILSALVFMIVIIILLKNQPSVMEKVIFSVVSLVAGALGGYGYGYKKGMEE